MIEGYIVKEKFDLCTTLCKEFIRENKIIILAIGSFSINEYEYIFEIFNYTNLIFWNMEQIEAFIGEKNELKKDTFEKVFKKLIPKDRLFVINDINEGIFVSKYDYRRNQIDFILQSFPNKIDNDSIVDFNGAHSALIGGFLSQFIKGESLFKCCKAGIEALYVILHNKGCVFPKNMILDMN